MEYSSLSIVNSSFESHDGQYMNMY